MKMLRFGAGSGCSVAWNSFLPVAFVRQCRFLQLVRKQSLRRKQRQEHINIDIGDHWTVRRLELRGKVASPRQALLFAAYRSKQNTPAELRVFHPSRRL